MDLTGLMTVCDTCEIHKLKFLMLVHCASTKITIHYTSINIYQTESYQK